ncbi:50S ribosomal protein L4 [Buchnera aphidicola]|uniref:50S ribosomal protein L4 n=1 Tax=Buchnera aphidicola TaxID=9 RepID=UPI003464C6AD
MKLIVQDEQSLISVSDEVFNKNFNATLVHQVVTSYFSMARQGSRAQKNKSEVSGSGKKPWRQKGTGRARSGSIRSPIWRSGGVTFAAKSKLYIHKINKKMYRGALKSILSKLVHQNRLMVFKDFSILESKTKILLNKLKEISIMDVLIITLNIDHNLLLASRNLYKVHTKPVNKIDPASLIYFKNVIITIEAIKALEDRLI